MKDQAEASKANILIVDDTPENLRLLVGILAEQGYIVRPATSGSRALATIRAELPDLILLDIKMPGMSGYEVCEHLKADERTRNIPVIFISALNETRDKVKGFSLGGVDYITKPFQPEEVLARIYTHVTLRTLQKRLENQNAQLQHEVIQRKQAEKGLQVLNQQLKETNQQLEEANTCKDAFFSIIAHDLRGPFTGLVGLTEVLIDDLESYNQEKLKQILHRIHISAEKTHALLNNLLTWSRLERGLIECEPGKIFLANMAERIIPLFATNAEQKQITLRHLVPKDAVAYADPKMIDSTLRNLLSNALKFTETGGEVTISTQSHEETVEIMVSDTGIGMTQERIEELFRIEAKTSTSGTAGEEGTGLGLILCKELVEKNRGTIRVESEVEKGSVFRVTLPRKGVME